MFASIGYDSICVHKFLMHNICVHSCGSIACVRVSVDASPNYHQQQNHTFEVEMNHRVTTSSSYIYSLAAALAPALLAVLSIFEFFIKIIHIENKRNE